MKKGLISIFVSSLLFSSLSIADENVTLTSKQVTENATKEATADAKSHQAKLVEEAIASLKLSSKALVELNHNKIDEAKKSVELALGKLETILSAENAPKLLPVDNRMVVKNFAGSADDVEKMIGVVKELLDKGKVPRGWRAINYTSE